MLTDMAWPYFKDIEDDWTQYLGPVTNQGDCGNCWAVSFLTVMSGIINKYLPHDVRQAYANTGDLISLSNM